LVTNSFRHPRKPSDALRIAAALPVFTAAILFLTAPAAAAGDVIGAVPSGDARPAGPPGESEKSSRLFPPRLVAWGFVYLPKASYSSEAGFGLGGQVIRPFRLPGSGPATPESDVTVKGRATHRKYSAIEASADLSLGARHSLKAKIGYDSLPLRFWGIGPNSPSEDEEVYRPQSVQAYVEVLREVLPAFRLGLRYEYERQKYLEVEEGGLLDTRGYRGTSGKPIVGTGPLFSYDTRDNRYSPTTGRYYQGFALFFDEAFGSHHDFNNYHVDVRHYHPLGEGRVLATQFFTYAAKGAAPVWRYAALGGRDHTRGYRKGRYLDRVLVAFQGEYRFRLFSRLGGAAFAGLAEVAKKLPNLKLTTMRPTLGGGLRLEASPKSGIMARFDVAVGGTDSVRFHLSLGEAF